MIPIAYHVSHEQFAPSVLLRYAQLAEQAGFDAIHSSDHFQPWSERQGESGFSLSWLGAAMQCTSIPFSLVCTPGYRYHPAMLAQAFATLAEMFPGRFSAELGSGEALNEVFTGIPWPPKPERNERLKTSVDIIRRLFSGEEVSSNGLIRTDKARLFSLPASPPPLLAAAITADTARWAGAWSDGLLTTAGSATDLQEKYWEFSRNGGSGKPLRVQFSFSWAEHRSTAIEGAWDQWRSNLVDRDLLANLSTPAEFDRASARITPTEVAEKIPILSTMEEIFQEVQLLEEAGATLVILHNINRNHEAFFEAFAYYKKS